MAEPLKLRPGRERPERPWVSACRGFAKQILASGEPLTWEEIEREVAERRGEVEQQTG